MTEPVTARYERFMKITTDTDYANGDRGPDIRYNPFGGRWDANANMRCDAYDYRKFLERIIVLLAEKLPGRTWWLELLVIGYAVPKSPVKRHFLESHTIPSLHVLGYGDDMYVLEIVTRIKDLDPKILPNDKRLNQLEVLNIAFKRMGFERSGGEWITMITNDSPRVQTGL